jgi:hypothetical protein
MRYLVVIQTRISVAYHINYLISTYFGTLSKNKSMFHFGNMTIVEGRMKLKKLVVNNEKEW